MAAEPITIYSSKIDPEGVLKCLQGLTSSLTVTRHSQGGWSAATVSVGRAPFRKPSTLTFGHARDYYTGEDFPNQILGMQGYFSRFPANEHTPRIMALIASFRFAITLYPLPVPELILDSRDGRLDYLFAVVNHLDGVIFTPSGLRDAAGRVLYHKSGNADPKAIMPGTSFKAPDRSALPRYKGGTAPNPPSPSAQRVARRAICLAAVAWRGMLERETEPHDRLERARIEHLRRLEACGLGPELEPDEWQLLQTPVGIGEPQDYLDAEWKIEGAALLTWALGQYDLPAYDAQSDVANVCEVLALDAPSMGRALLSNPVLRQATDVETLSTVLVAVHWRLREQHLRPGKKAFQQSSKNAWFGKLPPGHVRFIDGDLAIGEHPISDAPNGFLVHTTLVVQERHRAINWLCGDNDLYSKTDTPT